MNRWLLAGGVLSAFFAALHIAIIVGGPDWYLFFGAGQGIADLADQGSWIPPLLTFGIFLVLALWSLYAFSGAGLIRRLPLLRTGLVAIASIYLIRGLALVPFWIFRPGEVDGLLIWSSPVSFLAGGAYAAGTRRLWREGFPAPAAPRRF